MGTFSVIVAHLSGGVIPARPIEGPPGVVWVERSSAGDGFAAEGVGGGTTGEGFFLTASTFCFKGAVFFSLQIQRVLVLENPAKL